MRYLRLIAVPVILLTASLCLAADKSGGGLEDWLPITQQDLQINTVPYNADGSAIQLYYSFYKDESQGFEFVYRRIKILRDLGKKYADQEIRIEPGRSLKQFAARTIHPDGSVIDFKDQLYEKTIVKYRGTKYVAKTFAFPAVTVGSIIEFRYTLNLPPYQVDRLTVWPLESDLYTVKAKFRFRPYPGIVSGGEWDSSHGSRWAYTYLNSVGMNAPEMKGQGLMELDLENLVPFEPEDYMPPALNYEPAVLFYYGGSKMTSADQYWDDIGKRWSEWTEKLIGDYKDVRDVAAQVTANETDPEKKLRKLYAKAQSIRNLSWERNRTQQENLNKKINNAEDVLKNGYGYAFQINRLFVAMARAAGFDASVVQASEREDLLFEKNLLLPGQIDTTLAVVTLNGKDMVLDPGTPHCPFGVVPWNHTAVPAMRFFKKGAEFITTSNPESSTMHRTAKVALAADGTLKGDITIEYTGQDALQHRLDALDTDDAGRRKLLEDQVKAWMPQDAVVKAQDVKGWEGTDEPLVAHFTVEVPNYASLAGKRLVFPVFFFPLLKKEMFTHSDRKYPVMFSYPFDESDEISIKLPDGYSLEQPAYHRKSTLSYAKYEISNNAENNVLTTTRTLRFDGVRFEPELYSQVKVFFNIVQAGDAGQAVLQQGAASAEKKDGGN
jgi:transglutaminase superfamily protein/uncharacterized protein DUF3857